MFRNGRANDPDFAEAPQHVEIGWFEDAWKSHGTEINGSDQIWFAVIGPDTTPMGEIKTGGQYYQNQIARTVAAFLGVEYTGEGKAGEAIEQVIGK